MANAVMRTEALWKDKLIGIETIYTVVAGKQINIPEEIKRLREKSRNRELFCPCGCGLNLFLVAGDKQLRQQHFRAEHSEDKTRCDYVCEGATSIDSKIVLKCWLADKLDANDIESRVPICDVNDTSRRYEFTFLSRSKRVAIDYCRKRENLSDEKLKILDDNGHGIRITHIVDEINGGSQGQFPEGLMKIQERQGYCLLLHVDGREYSEASMQAVLYEKNLDGLWEEICFTEEKLTEFVFDAHGQLWLRENQSLNDMAIEARKSFAADLVAEQQRREEEKKARKKREEYIRADQLKALEEKQELADKQKQEAEIEAQLAQEAREREEADHGRRMEEFIKSLPELLSQTEHKVRDPDGKLWFRCELCGKKASEEEFSVMDITTGKCRSCMDKNAQLIRAQLAESSKKNKLKDDNRCPICGGALVRRYGSKGSFWGCENFPNCDYTRSDRNSRY